MYDRAYDNIDISASSESESQDTEMDVPSVPSVPYVHASVNVWWRDIWRVDRKRVVSEYCDEKYLKKIETAVNGNPARARHNAGTRDRMIATLYYNLCFSRRGPWFHEHRDVITRLRADHREALAYA